VAHSADILAEMYCELPTHSRWLIISARHLRIGVDIAENARPRLIENIAMALEVMGMVEVSARSTSRIPICKLPSNTLSDLPLQNQRQWQWRLPRD